MTFYVAREGDRESIFEADDDDEARERAIESLGDGAAVWKMIALTGRRLRRPKLIGLPLNDAASRRPGALVTDDPPQLKERVLRSG